MFTLKVEDNIIEYCKEIVSKYNFGQRSKHNGTKENQLTGIIGQCAILSLFNLPLVKGGEGFDGGVDIEYAGYRIDVKTMGRNTSVKDYYVNNFIKLQDNYDTDIYFFCSFNRSNNELTFCGWIDKKNFIQRRIYYPQGHIRTRSDGSTFATFTDLYEISNKDLYKVNGVEELKQSLLNHVR